jgi:hypothetical protein
MTEGVDEEEALSKERGLPLIRTDDTDKKGLQRINADERGSGRDSPLITLMTLISGAYRGSTRMKADWRAKGGNDANVRRETWPTAWNKPTLNWDTLG